MSTDCRAGIIVTFWCTVLRFNTAKTKLCNQTLLCAISVESNPVTVSNAELMIVLNPTDASHRGDAY